MEFNAFTPHLALTQGLYFVLTGIWPLVSIRTFLRATGPKTDLWLVKTVGVLVAVIGAGLIAGAAAPSVPLAVLGIGAGLGLAAIDCIYVLKRTIPPIYLADAALELILVLAWAAVLLV